MKFIDVMLAAFEAMQKEDFSSLKDRPYEKYKDKLTDPELVHMRDKVFGDEAMIPITSILKNDERFDEFLAKVKLSYTELTRRLSRREKARFDILLKTVEDQCFENGVMVNDLVMLHFKGKVKKGLDKIGFWADIRQRDLKVLQTFENGLTAFISNDGYGNGINFCKAERPQGFDEFENLITCNEVASLVNESCMIVAGEKGTYIHARIAWWVDWLDLAQQMKRLPAFIKAGTENNLRRVKFEN